MPEHIDISIIIPAKNEEKNIYDLLSDIKKQELNGIIAEVIVADAKSTDDTVKVATGFGARVAKGGLPGVGRNNGARIAKGRILYMMDADIRLPDKKFLKKSYEEFSKRGLDCAVMDNKPFILGIKKDWEKYMIKGLYEFGNIWIRAFQRTENPNAIGTCMIFKKKSFEEIGGFDERIYFAEDSAIVKKLSKKGYKFRVLHHPIYIYFSPRRPILQGVLRFFLNTAKLEMYRRRTNKEIHSRKMYKRLTNIADHYKK